jgi:hypothetical protein
MLSFLYYLFFGKTQEDIHSEEDIESAISSEHSTTPNSFILIGVPPIRNAEDKKIQEIHHQIRNCNILEEDKIDYLLTLKKEELKEILIIFNEVAHNIYKILESFDL